MAGLNLPDDDESVGSPPHPDTQATQQKHAGGEEMAIRRPTPIDQAPGELLTFDPSEWAAPEESSWRPAFERWKAGRRRWLAEHARSDLGRC